MSDQIATYTFLPWLRQGIVSNIKGEDNLGTGAGIGERASVTISLKVNGDANFVSQNVQLVGPGDVVGISPRAIVRTEPRNWITDFEPNYLAFVEFYDEDFPWRFTPARAIQRNNAGNPVSNPQHTKLRPWIFLLVLEEEEFEEVGSSSSPLPAIRLTGTVALESIVPPAAQSWAWAHVHVNRDITAGSTLPSDQTVDALELLVRQNPDHALSRLICPRKLNPSTSYHAFVIPSFEVGRLAGLGKPTEGLDALAPSWGTGQTEYPVYYRWFFRTGERGDFEYLVNLLEPREVDERVGIRDMDMQAPNFGARGMSSTPGDVPVMGLEGALKSPQAQPKPDVFPPPDPANYPAFLNDLTELVNLQDTLLTAEDGHPDPIISPPLYGRWHGLQSRLETGQQGWVNELNQDPRLRTPAGFGTKVIQTGQEGYMQRAWQQLGDILRANQKIRQVQVSIATSMQVFTKHFVNLAPEQQIAITQQVHARVMGSPTTVFHQIRESRLPQAAVNPAFRRVVRPRGVIARKAFTDGRANSTEILAKLNTGQIAAAVPKRAPQQQISLTRAANRLPNRRLAEENLTARVVSGIPARSAFIFTLPGQNIPTTPTVPETRDSAEGGTFRSAVLDLHSRLETTLPAPDPKPEINVVTISGALVNALNPKVAILQRALSVIHIPPTFEYLRPKETIVPIMGHPVFADPMYKPLRDLSSELLLPNLQLIPNNTITLLETNPRFIEAYMVGLNHEMARELLWREYPADQRGSYFRQFWDVGEIVNRTALSDVQALEEAHRDIRPLHTWGQRTRLGTHGNRTLPTGREAANAKKLVLVIRGDLLKKYPTAVIFAQQGMWVKDEEDPSPTPRFIRVLSDGDPKDSIKEPIFKAEIEPDIHFLGFDLTAKVAKGDPTPPQTTGDSADPGWFFVIQERPGEPRFGLDILDSEETLPAVEEWDDLSWNHLGSPDDIRFIDVSTPIQLQNGEIPDKNILWGSNAADMAYILFQDSVMVAIHADNMLE